MTAPTDEDEMTELVDADFPRVDLVGKGANGIPRWLIAKQADGLVPAEMVRDLIGKQADDADVPQSRRERVTTSGGVTINASPADLAAFLAKARQPDIDVAKEAAVAGPVAKDAVTDPDTDSGVDGLDPTVAAGPEPDGDYPGSPSEPGSPAWEAQDASTAQKWLSIAARLKNALAFLAEREMLEAASADPDDCENAWDLQDAMCAVDYVSATLAVFAAGEQAEADLGGEAMAAIGKALDGSAAEPLPVIEGLCAVAKSGRVLSSVNEQRIREATASLQQVLSSLPQAPVPDDGQPVAKSKETTVTATATQTEPVAKDTAPAETVDAGGTTTMGEPSGQPAEPLPGDVPGRAVTKSASLPVLVYDQHRRPFKILPDRIGTVIKADADAEGKTTMQAVFDEDGNLVGIVDPADITPVAGAGPKADASETADAAPAADPSDMTPQPPAEAGTPAGAVSDDDTVTKQDGTLTLTQDVLKSIMTDAITTALGAREPAEDIAKQADVAGLRAEVEALLADVEVLKEQPAAPKVFTNGAVPPPSQMRGQDQGATGQPVDVTKAAELQKQFLSSDSTAPQQAEAFHALEGMAHAKFAQIRAAGPMGSPAAS